MYDTILSANEQKKENVKPINALFINFQIYEVLRE